MGTYYAIYAEVRVGNQWYNLNPLFQCAGGSIDVCPVISGRNWLREAYEELEEVCGLPEENGGQRAYYRTAASDMV